MKWVEKPGGGGSYEYWEPGDIAHEWCDRTPEGGCYGDSYSISIVECVENFKVGAGNFRTITSPTNLYFNQDEKKMRFIGCDGPDDSVTAEFFNEESNRVERGYPCATVGFFYANKNHGLFEGSLETLAKKMNGEIPITENELYRNPEISVLPKEKERLLEGLAKEYIHGAIVGGVQAGAAMAVAQLMADARNSALMMLAFPPLPPPPLLS